MGIYKVSSAKYQMNFNPSAASSVKGRNAKGIGSAKVGREYSLHMGGSILQQELNEAF